ncbi:hypothetical protein AXG93_2035s1360 [Marchantia polymorpha subsp. ruderalis]|uniref:Uncharacterized protein n=1 Tax=Marchantia polymorpha subsp. ruderalis TaxID=1480154 RepID=A0A176VR28_MARPO|nr:hypothetical protein AXG93_2035s1360 [Marchantia polymorpha subsp. ruderalis]
MRRDSHRSKAMGQDNDIDDPKACEFLSALDRRTFCSSKKPSKVEEKAESVPSLHRFRKDEVLLLTLISEGHHEAAAADGLFFASSRAPVYVPALDPGGTLQDVKRDLHRQADTHRKQQPPAPRTTVATALALYLQVCDGSASPDRCLLFTSRLASWLNVTRRNGGNLRHARLSGDMEEMEEMA